MRNKCITLQYISGLIHWILIFKHFKIFLTMFISYVCVHVVFTTHTWVLSPSLTPHPYVTGASPPLSKIKIICPLHECVH